MKNAISLESVKNFIEASILNAIDNDLLSFDWKRLKIDILETTAKDENGLDIEVYKARISYLGEIGKDQGFNYSLAAPVTEDRDEALRHVIGLTINLLNGIKQHSSKPVLTVIEGGKID